MLSFEKDRRTLDNDKPLRVGNLYETINELTALVANVTDGDWDARPYSIAHYTEQIDYYARVGTNPAIRTVCEVRSATPFSWLWNKKPKHAQKLKP